VSGERYPYLREGDLFLCDGHVIDCLQEHNKSARVAGEGRVRMVCE
jgi:hypothetical protein